MTKLNNVVNDIEQYLKHQIEEGEVNTEISQDIMEKLSNKKTTKPTTVATADTKPKSKPAPAKTEPPKAAQKSIPTPIKATQPATPVKVDTTGCADMDAINLKISKCTQCTLAKTRTNTVPGQGNTSPDIMFIGEAPGAKEDEQGRPFVGRSGNFLEKMIGAMGYSRETVFIGNILKCRPPDNRKPTQEEIDICIPYLKQQIAVLKPKVIIALGATSVKGLLGKMPAISKLRGEWQEFEGIPLMPTFHPAYILRNQTKKGELWADLKKVLAFLGKPPR